MLRALSPLILLIPYEAGIVPLYIMRQPEQMTQECPGGSVSKLRSKPSGLQVQRSLPSFLCAGRMPSHPSQGCQVLAGLGSWSETTSAVNLCSDFHSQK